MRDESRRAETQHLSQRITKTESSNIINCDVGAGRTSDITTLERFVPFVLLITVGPVHLGMGPVAAC